MADNKEAAKSGQKSGGKKGGGGGGGGGKGGGGGVNKNVNDEQCPFTGRNMKRFDATYTCSNEECKNQNHGTPYEYTSNTNVPETHRKCPKCGTLNEKHSGE